jgi:CheY-like chemotaxis protein
MDVVDDEEDNVTLFTKVLQEIGYHAMGLTNPLFILYYSSEYPDRFSLIIVDYRMMSLQGSELTMDIAAINPKIKMVFLTAYDNVTNNDYSSRINNNK